MPTMRYRSSRVWTADLGLACCAVEVAAAEVTRPGLVAETPADPPAALDVLLVSGTVTHALAPLVRRRYDALVADGATVRVVSVGACADSGGPYWDSYAVAPGVGSVVPVDVFVPGCPPRPEAVLDALDGLVP